MTFAKYRDRLPQLNGKNCLTDGGLETSLVFHEGFDLPLFAAFTLLNNTKGRSAIERYMNRFCEVARRDGKGFILDMPTWRASTKWGRELGFSDYDLKKIHSDAVEMLLRLRAEWETPDTPMVINGVIGPHGDGYNPEAFLSAREAEDYHSQQIAWLDEMAVDMISALTMTYVEEALGIAKAAKRYNIPAVISFTVETDGKLPSGQDLQSAIEQIEQETDSSPAYYMINCAHPDHFIHLLETEGEWKKRIMGLRANASRMSHEELDNSEELDDGDPKELGIQYRDLRSLLPNLQVMGGCCGTDHRHIDAISACTAV